MTTSGWQLRKISGPTTEPISRDQAKAQCRVDPDITEDDAWFDEAITEARAYVEDQLKSTLVETEYEIAFEEWPCGWDAATGDGRIELPFGPILGVDSVHHLDTDGADTLLAESGYRLIQNGTTGFLLPAYGDWWPPARVQAQSIRVRYRAGYPSTGSPAGADGVPPPVVRGIKMLVAHWYQNRETVLTGTISDNIAKGLEDVISAYRNLP